MFDAKSILEALVRGAAPQASAQPQSGGLGDILGQVLKGGGQQSGGLGDILGQLQRSLQPQDGQSGSAPGGTAPGGIDILKELEKMARGASNNAVEDRHSGAPASGGHPGGLGDILGQLKDKMGQAGAGGLGGGQQGGGLMDILTQVLSQATQGVKEGAGRIDDATGATDVLGKALGKAPQDVLGQLQDMIRNNPLAAGTAIGGLGGLVLGTHTGRAVAGSAARLGALALIGGLAFKAFQNYQAGRPLITGATAAEAAPQGSGFEADAVTNESAALYLKSMIAAAAADGRLDGAEQAKIIGGLKQAGLDAEAEQFLADVFNNPPSADDLANAAASPEEAVQVYTAARIAIEPDTAAEKTFLAQLAAALGIDAKLASHIDATARSAAA